METAPSNEQEQNNPVNLGNEWIKTQKRELNLPALLARLVEAGIFDLQMIALSGRKEG